METEVKDKNGKESFLQVLSEVTNRMALSSKLGTDTYGGVRDMYTALGYP